LQLADELAAERFILGERGGWGQNREVGGR
jgi:hypothetical protein